jgi:hypothetical protein
VVERMLPKHQTRVRFSYPAQCDIVCYMKTVIKAEEVKSMRYSVPRSLINAAGMLKGKLPQGVKYQQQIRHEWLGRFTNKLLYI